MEIIQPGVDAQRLRQVTLPAESGTRKFLKIYVAHLISFDTFPRSS